ncbi:MAG: hypothetical protein HY040_01065 [Planctomycetes bacterium]|nr:hypothetical protein [Planctomycetota bacterium]
MEKLLAMHVAAQLTNAALAGNGTVPIDPEIKDPQVRAKNLQVWETFRVFYRGVAGALQDEQSWPSPKINAGQILPGLLQSVIPLLSTGPFAEIVKKLLASLPAPALVPTGPLPDPGVKSAA